MIEMIQAVEDDVIVVCAANCGAAALRIGCGSFFSGRIFGFEFLDQSFHGMRNADGKLATLEQRFERLDGRGVAAPAQRSPS